MEQRHTHWWKAGLLVLLLGLEGCARFLHRSDSAVGLKTSPPTTEAEALEQADQRAKAYAHYATGLVHELNDRPDEALAELYQAALADPTNEELVADVAQEFVLRKKPESALDLLTQACTKTSTSVRLDLLLGQAQAQTGLTNQAIKTFQGAITKAPQTITGYQNLAELYLQSGQSKKTRQLLDQAAGQSDLNTEFILDLVELYLAHQTLFHQETNQFKSRLMSLLEQVQKASETPPLTLFRCATAYAALQENQRADALYTKLYEQNPTMNGLRERMADFYWRNNDPKRAIDLLEKIVREHPVNPHAYYLLGRLAVESGDYQTAIDYYKKCLVLNPTAETVPFELAGVLISINQTEEALKTLEVVRARKPRDFLVEFYTGLAYSRQKDYRQALSHLVAAEIIAKAGETNRLNHALFFQLGAIYERNGDYEQSEKYFRLCLEKRPNDAETLNYLGYMWAEKGIRLNEAQELIEKAVAIEPDNAAYLDSLAWVLYKLDRLDEAMPYMLKAVELATEPDPTLYDHLGDLYAAQKEYEKARVAYERSLELEPNEEIRKKLQSLP